MASFREKFASAALHSVMVIILEAILSGAFTAAVVRLIAAVAVWNREASIYAAVALGISVTAGVLLALLMVRMNIVVIPFKHFDYTFDFRKFSINYSDLVKPVHKRRYTVRSNVAGLDRITDAFCWSAGEAGLPTCSIGECEVRSGGKSGLFTVFEVVFPNRLGKGQTKEIELTWALENAMKTAGPFLSMTVTQPTALVEFEATLPSDSYKSPAYLTSCPHVQVRLSDDTKEIAFNDGHVTGQITNPRLFSHNEIRWRWA